MIDNLIDRSTFFLKLQQKNREVRDEDAAIKARLAAFERFKKEWR